MHATFLPLSPKDDEQQGNDVNIRMIKGVHSRISDIVRFLRQFIRVQDGRFPDMWTYTAR